MSQINTALWVKGPNQLHVAEAPFPVPSSDEVVIRAAAWAVNPVDRFQAELGMLLEHFPCIHGVDVAGTVVAVGQDIKDFKTGDRVVGIAPYFGTKLDKHAAYQVYPALKLPQLALIPNNVTFEQAAVLPLGIDTASAGLFEKDQLALEMPPSNKGKGKTLIIWGGSSSVGACAIGLAANAGYEVLTTSSPRNFDLCRSVGASQVFDYNKSTIEDDIVEALEGKEIVGAFATIHSQDDDKAFNSLCRILKRAGGRQFVSSVLPDAKGKGIEGVQSNGVFATSVTWNGVGSQIWGTFLPKAIESGAFLCKPDPEVVGSGLEDLPKAFEVQKKGVSGKKLVVKSL